MQNVDFDLSTIQLHASNQDRHCFGKLPISSVTKNTFFDQYLHDIWKNTVSQFASQKTVFACRSARVIVY